MAVESYSALEAARARGGAIPRRGLGFLPAALAVVVCVAPGLMVLAAAAAAPLRGFAAGGLLLESALGLLTLLTFGGGGAVALGAGAAWLVAACRFPGRSVFEWLLAAPLAAPAYVLAYAYGAMTGPGGPAPIGLSGAAGASFVFALAFYPYVYLATRAALAGRSAQALEAAQTLGLTPAQTAWRVALPLAWPGIAAGAALACMEIAADYGAVAYFGAPSMTTGIFRAWFSRGDPGAALQLASLLLLGAGVLLAAERAARGARGFADRATAGRPHRRYPLAPLAAFLAMAACAGLVLLGVGLPALWLLRLASFAPDGAHTSLLGPLGNSLALALGGAALALALATPIALAARAGATWGRFALFAASTGYAAPGAVIALGALAALGLLREAGLVAGLTGGLAIASLIWVYAARFVAAGAQPLDAGFARVSGAIGAAARTLGASRGRRIIAVDLPLAAPSVAAAGLILFVEILRELPATLLLRPFNFDTLAVAAHSLAADDRLSEAAGPALLILLAGMAPILILARRISGERGP